ncbi:hypothetical protein [Asaia sp. VD9]|uniref:hypothetical protein n=1 Tax=Asaia sp. VD9 TaxID=3081235 RepID=UPI0030195C3C
MSPEPSDENTPQACDKQFDAIERALEFLGCDVDAQHLAHERLQGLRKIVGHADRDTDAIDVSQMLYSGHAPIS